MCQTRSLDELERFEGLLRGKHYLEGKTVTADPLYCQKDTAHAIVENGGNYFLEIKGNQLAKSARAVVAQKKGTRGRQSLFGKIPHLPPFITSKQTRLPDIRFVIVFYL